MCSSSTYVYVAVLLKNTLFEQAIFCHSLYMLHELSPKMGATALNNAAVLLRLYGLKVLGIAMWPWGHGHGYWYAHGEWHGRGHV